MTLPQAEVSSARIGGKEHVGLLKEEFPGLMPLPIPADLGQVFVSWNDKEISISKSRGLTLKGLGHIFVMHHGIRHPHNEVRL